MKLQGFFNLIKMHIEIMSEDGEHLGYLDLNNPDDYKKFFRIIEYQFSDSSCNNVLIREV